MSKAMAEPLRYRVRSDHPISVVEFLAMHESGEFVGLDRVELIEGRLIEKSLAGPRHIRSVNVLTELSVLRASSVVEVSVQNTDVISEFNAPEPDLTLLRRDRDVTTVPGVDDILLIVEVSDSSVRFDRKVKLAIYAEAGVPEYWIVNIPEERIECYRDPVDGRYATVRLFRGDDDVDALLIPELGTIPANRILRG